MRALLFAPVLSLALAAAPLAAPPAFAAGGHVVINEAYVNGGSSGATYENKYVELYNPTGTAVSLDGWSLQYRAYSSTGAASATPLSGTIPAKGYYLIEGTANAANGVDWTATVTPDATSTTSWSGNSNGGTLILASTATALTPPSGSVVSDEDQIVDLLGYTKSNTFEGHVEESAGSVTTAFARTDGVDTDDNAADFTAASSFAPTNSAGVTYGGTDPGDPGPTPTTPIHEIQGTGSTSPLVGQTVTTTGFVTAAYPTGGYRGYTIQEAGSGSDLDDSSDAVFVYSSATVGQVAIGDYVQVTGAVSEYQGLTELSVASGGLSELPATGVTPPVAARVTWPRTDAAREALESMLVAPQGDYTVTDTYSTNYYASIGLASGTTPLRTPTDAAAPGSAAAQAVADDNAARAVTLDDGASINFNSAANKSIPLPYLSLEDPVRVGAPVTFTRPVIVDYRNSLWTLEPTQQLTVANAADVQPATFANTRTAKPADVGGKVRIASFNVLNYFSTTGADAEALGATCTYYSDRDGNPITVNTCTDPGVRGAADAASLARQQAKIVAAINSLGVDVVSLEEIENSAIAGQPRDAALATLTAALNAAAGTTRWAYVPSPTTLPATEDVIRTAFIYNPATVKPVGESVIDTDSAFDNARYPLAQVFTPRKAAHRPFITIANHFKSKGSCPAEPDDPNADTGQGCWNALRVEQSTALASFATSLAASARTDRVFLIGDFNAYTHEDPITALAAAGYTDQGGKTGKYSYSYGGESGSLDHILASSAAEKLVTGADIWNINAGESIALEYSRYNYNATNFYDASPYRSSDHDPVVVGFALKVKPARTHTALTLSQNRVPSGTAVTATATVRGAATGTVVFRYDRRTITAALVGGVASVALPASLSVGRHSVRAFFTGTDAARPSVSATVWLTVTRAKGGVAG